MSQAPVIPTANAWKSQNLWDQALGSLTDAEKALVDFQAPDRLTTLESALRIAEEKRDQCRAKGWKIRRGNGKFLILRDVLEKIVVWIDRFKQIGDTAIQYDPGHAALPWAGVCLLLQMAINESQTFGAMIEGLERVSCLIQRYAIFEHLYLRHPSPTVDRLKGSLATLYAAILQFLGKVLHYFGQKKDKRIAKSAVGFTDTVLNPTMIRIKESQLDVDRDARLVNAELQQATLAELDAIGSCMKAWAIDDDLTAIKQGMVLLDAGASRPAGQFAR